MASGPSQVREWRKQVGENLFLVSSKPSLLEHEFINGAFESDDMFWAKRVDPEELQLMLSQSQTLGVYKQHKAEASAEPSSPRTPSPTIEEPSEPRPELEMVGMARFITDFVSTSYLTDVYISPQYRKLGLGDWVVACCKEVLESMPSLRRVFLMANASAGKAYYKKTLGMWDVVEEKDQLACMSRKAYKPGES